MKNAMIYHGANPPAKKSSGGSGGVDEFVALGDTPNNYTGSANKVVKVNGSETGLVFVAGGSGGADSFVELDDTPDNYAGSANKVVTVNSAGTGLEFTSNIPVAGGAGLLVGANPNNCSNVAGFSDRFNAIKLGVIQEGTISEMSWRIFNTYGARQIEGGVYDEAGTLLSRTGVITLVAGYNGDMSTPLSIPVSIVSGQQLWLGVWADGVDIPSYGGYANLNSTFPSGCHAVANTSATSLPTTISSSYPFGLTNITLPLNGIV